MVLKNFAYWFVPLLLSICFSACLHSVPILPLLSPGVRSSVYCVIVSATEYEYLKPFGNSRTPQNRKSVRNFPAEIEEQSVCQRWRNCRSRSTSQSWPAVWLITSAFWSLEKCICHLDTINSCRFDTFFGSTYLCKETFSQVKIMKSICRSHLTHEHLKYCHHLCLKQLRTAFQ
jgi:hypothetical protein